MVVGSSALIAILLGEPDGDALAVTLAAAPSSTISAPNWLEAMMVISARLGSQGEQALSELVDAAGLNIEPADADLARLACLARLARLAFEAWQRFGKGRRAAGLNFGDCFAYALATRRGEALLFKGNDFAQTDVCQSLRPR